MHWQVTAGLVMLALVAGWTANGWRLGQKIEEERVVAAKTLAKETAKVLAAEQRATTRRNELEAENVRVNKTIEKTLADNRRLSRELGGLRDPGSREACDTLSRAPGDHADPAPGAKLSREAEEFLFEFAADADRAAAYANTCYQWASKPLGANRP